MSSAKRNRYYPAIIIKALSILILIVSIIAVASPLTASTFVDCESGCEACFIDSNRASTNISAINVSSFNQCEQSFVVSYNASENEIKPFLTASSIEHPPKF